MSADTLNRGSPLEHLAVTDQTIQAARDHWAWGNGTVTLVAARENHVYRVDSPNGAMALRLHRPGYRCVDEIESEVLWMNMLATNGLAVPKPIPATDGTYYRTFNGVTVTLLSWLDGTPWSKLKLTPQMYFALGRELSKMHSLADAWKLPAGFNRPTWDLIGDQPTWDRFWENPQLSNKQAIVFLKFRDSARNTIDRMAPLDIGLIHADLVPDNVLYSSQLLQLIDFDDGGFGHRLFDLATITRRSRHISHNDVFADAAIDGYCATREIDRDALMLFEALRACTYVGWNIKRMNEPSGNERNARYIAEAELAIERIYRISS